MNDSIQNTIAEVFAIEDQGIRVTLKDKSKRSLGSFFKNKQDGKPTVAYQQFQDMNIQSGSVVEIGFKETPDKTKPEIVYKNIIGFREAKNRPVQETSTQPIKSSPRADLSATEPKDDKFWDKKAYKQCLWNYWLTTVKVTRDDENIAGLSYTEMDLVYQVFNQIEQDADKRFSKPEPYLGSPEEIPF